MPLACPYPPLTLTCRPILTPALVPQDIVSSGKAPEVVKALQDAGVTVYAGPQAQTDLKELGLAVCALHVRTHVRAHARARSHTLLPDPHLRADPWPPGPRPCP